MALGKAIEADRYLAIAYYQRAWVNTQLGDYPKALKDYIQAYQVFFIKFNTLVNEKEFGY